MTTEPTDSLSEDQLRFVLHAARRLQLVTMIAMACDLAFGVGYAWATDLEPWEVTLIAVIFAVALVSWMLAVFCEAAVLRAIRRLS